MPRTYRKRKTYRKRTYRKRPSAYRINRGVPDANSRIGFPTRRMVSFKYNEYIALNPGVASADNWVFSCNNLIDPNLTGGGHQPYGLDQILNVFYNKFTVIGARIKCTFVGNAAGEHNTVGIAIRKQSTTSSGPSLLQERPYTRKSIISGVASGSNGMKSVVQNFSTRSFLAIRDPLSEANLSGSVSAGPSREAFFHVFVAPIDTVTNNLPVDVNVEVDYIAIMHDPKALGQS